jgi:excisionase family DNA binding protein
VAATRTRHAQDSDQWMSVGEAAEACGLSEESVRRNLVRGTIPVRALRIGTCIRIDRPAFNEWFMASLLNAD